MTCLYACVYIPSRPAAGIYAQCVNICGDISPRTYSVQCDLQRRTRPLEPRSSVQNSSKKRVHEYQLSIIHLSATVQTLRQSVTNSQEDVYMRATFVLPTRYSRERKGRCRSCGRPSPPGSITKTSRSSIMNVKVMEVDTTGLVQGTGGVGPVYYRW